MSYKVVPFKAQVQAGQGADLAASQLEELITDHESSGWTFVGLEMIETVVVTPAVPGDNGCFGFGATPGQPEQRNNVAAYVAVFRKP